MRSVSSDCWSVSVGAGSLAGGGSVSFPDSFSVCVCVSASFVVTFETLTVCVFLSLSLTVFVLLYLFLDFFFGARFYSFSVLFIGVAVLGRLRCGLGLRDGEVWYRSHVVRRWEPGIVRPVFGGGGCVAAGCFDRVGLTYLPSSGCWGFGRE